MAEEPRPAAPDRIARAITRIEAAITADRAARDALTRRHEALRARVSDAIATLDGLVEPG